VAENYLNGSFLPLFLEVHQEHDGVMEFIGVLLFIVFIVTAAASISAVLRDGRGHLPPDRSEPWTARDLPDNSCWTLRAF
jgi:hypothetical protein